MPVREDDLRDRDLLVAPAAVRQRRIDVRHLERADAIGEPAERLGWVGVKVCRDAELISHRGHAALGEVGGELCEDRVVGGDERLLDVERFVEAATAVDRHGVGRIADEPTWLERVR
jgi:hypothetical protein